jgi:hypothetical protein
MDEATIKLVVDLCEALECQLYPQFGKHPDPKEVNRRALVWIDRYAMDPAPTTGTDDAISA